MEGRERGGRDPQETTLRRLFYSHLAYSILRVMNWMNQFYLQLNARECQLFIPHFEASAGLLSPNTYEKNVLGC